MRITDETRDAYRALMSAIFFDNHLFRRLYGVPEPETGEVDRLLAKFRLAEKTELTDGEFSTLELSGGQRRRLALIVSLLEKRPILLLDEWTAEQDPEFRRKFYDELLPEMLQSGATVVVITHDDRYLDELHLPARRIRMDEGRIVEWIRWRATDGSETRSLDGEPPPTRRNANVEAHLRATSSRISSTVLMALILVGVVLDPYMVIRSRAAMSGVMWKRFRPRHLMLVLVGAAPCFSLTKSAEEGLHSSGLGKLFIYDQRLQSGTETYNAISKEGVSLTATINIRDSTQSQRGAGAPQVHRPGIRSAGGAS